MSYRKILKEASLISSKKKAKILSGFFKTGKGDYGEGDIFLGITVPQSRKIAQKHYNISLTEISQLLDNQYHEIRLIALLILVDQSKNVLKDNIQDKQKELFKFYLKHTKRINNWDLVDLSAPIIIGNYLASQPSNFTRGVLMELAKSKNIWDRRIAIVSTFSFIKVGEPEWTLCISKMLLKDEHDLINKACGWMLREVGKRVGESHLTRFLDLYSLQMPRTMLRYAIERLPENKRLYYLKLK